MGDLLMDVLPVPGQAEPAETAPALPIEYSLVDVVRKLELAKWCAEQALLRLQFAARDANGVYEMLNQHQQVLNAAANSYQAYLEIINCRGQA